MLSNIPLIGQAKMFNQNEEIIASNPMLDLNRSNALNYLSLISVSARIESIPILL